jgi:Pyridoxamine 5'-phosphate oxidase
MPPRRSAAPGERDLPRAFRYQHAPVKRPHRAPNWMIRAPRLTPRGGIARSRVGDRPGATEKWLIAHCPRWRETGRVDVTDLDADPLRQLATWLDAARAAGQPMPEAMTIASATSDAVPSARLVVLRGLRRGLVFFTECESDKGAELAADPRAAAVLHWLVPAHRQVRVAGPVERVSPDEADEYWSTRAPSVRLSAPPRTKAALSPAGRSWKCRSRTCSGVTLAEAMFPVRDAGAASGCCPPRRVLAGIAGRPARSDPLPPGRRRLDHRAAVAVTIRRPEIPNGRGWRRTPRCRGPPGSMNAAVPRGRGLRRKHDVWRAGRAFAASSKERAEHTERGG